MTDEIKPTTPDEITTAFAAVMRGFAEAYNFECAAVLRIPIDETGRAHMFATSTTTPENTAYLLHEGLRRVLAHPPNVTSEDT